MMLKLNELINSLSPFKTKKQKKDSGSEPKPNSTWNGPRFKIVDENDQSQLISRWHISRQRVPITSPKLARFPPLQSFCCHFTPKFVHALHRLRSVFQCFFLFSIKLVISFNVVVDHGMNCFQL